MNEPKRKTDIIVGVISKKRDGLAKLIAEQIQMIFRDSHLSVIAEGESDHQKFYGLVERSSIVVVDKSLEHDLHGTDGLELLDILATKYPHKKFMVMSSYYDESELTSLTAARFKLRKPVQLNIWKETIEHCVREIEIQREIDSGLWKRIEEG